MSHYDGRACGRCQVLKIALKNSIWVSRPRAHDRGDRRDPALIPFPAEAAQNLKMAQGVDVQIGRDRDRSRRNDSDVTVGIGSGGVTVGPRQNCRMVTTTVERADGRSITRKERRCD